jgi:hypothetical protein
MICITEITIIIIIFILFIIFFILFNNKQTINHEYDKKMSLLNELIDLTEQNVSKIKDKIERTENENERIMNRPEPQLPLPNFPNTFPSMDPRQMPVIDPVSIRDRRVLHDPLYPPLGRTDRPTFDLLSQAKERGVFNFATRGTPDTFRIIGYMINKDELKDIGNNIWKIFGRQKYPSSSIGEYYVIPANDHKTDIKIRIKDDMIIGEKLRDIYSLPKYIQFKSTIFNKSKYEIIELDKSDLISDYI